MGRVTVYYKSIVWSVQVVFGELSFCHFLFVKEKWFRFVS